MRSLLRHNWLAYGLFLLPVLTFGWLLVEYAVNLPWADDSSFMVYVYRRLLPDPWNDFWADTFNQHIDHRIATPRLLVWGLYLIEGELNFRTAIWMGNLSLLGSVYLLYRSFRRSGQNFWLFVPVAFFIFHPLHFLDSLWTICVYQHNVLVFWILLSLECLQSSRKGAFLLALFAALAATYTGGNGMFIWLPGLLLLVVQKRYRLAVYWAIIVGLLAGLYFIGLEPGQETRIHESLSQPLRLLTYTFTFLGGMTMALSPSVTYASVLGLILSLLLLLSMMVSFRKPMTWSAMGLLFFLGLSAGAAAASRSWSGVSITERYQIYAAFALASGYLLFINLLQDWVGKPFLNLAGLFVAVSFWLLAWYTKYPFLTQRRDSLISECYNWSQHGKFLNVVPFHNQALQYAYPPLIARKIFRLPQDVDQPNEKGASFTSTVVEMQYDTAALGNPLTVRTSEIDLNALPVYLVIKSSTQATWMAPFHTIPNAKIAFLKTFKPLYPGGAAEFMTESLPGGTYRLGLYQNQQLRWLKQTFTKSD